VRPVWIIAALLALYAVVAWTSVSGKSATYDEPLHLASAMAQSQLGDYRIDPEDPAMFKRWLAIGLPERPLPVDTDLWRDVAAKPQAQWAWSVLAVFGDDFSPLVTRGRAMMLLAALALGALIATWAWQIRGPAAAVIATTLFALDPNFLAHGSIAKNDVIASLGFVATAYAIWQVRRRVSWLTVAGLAIAAGVTVTVKYSGIMVVGLVPLLLIVSLFLSSRDATRPGIPGRVASRLLEIASITAVVWLTCWAFIWAAYGFRYNPSPDPSFQFDLASRTTTTPVLRIVDHYHLLPQAYTYGLAYTIDSTNTRDAFLFERKSNTGWWYYFPVAMAVKTPVAMIAALFAALGLCRWRLRKHGWTLACLIIPAAIYTALALRSHLNIGLRHMLPVYPLAFIAIGVVLSKYRKTAITLLTLLAVESTIAYPDYMAYFNLLAGGPRGGVRILSDSNLDWGQDLPLLADWQAKHPGTKLYLSYFGTADPASYGVQYTNVGAGYGFVPTTMPTDPGVIAVSATHLQGMYVAPNLQWFYRALRTQKPIDVLGGTIYLYEWK
jgi:hypothetical protein